MSSLLYQNEIKDKTELIARVNANFYHCCGEDPTDNYFSVIGQSERFLNRRVQRNLCNFFEKQSKSLAINISYRVVGHGIE